MKRLTRKVFLILFTVCISSFFLSENLYALKVPAGKIDPSSPFGRAVKTWNLTKGTFSDSVASYINSADLQTQSIIQARIELAVKQKGTDAKVSKADVEDAVIFHMTATQAGIADISKLKADSPLPKAAPVRIDSAGRADVVEEVNAQPSHPAAGRRQGPGFNRPKANTEDIEPAQFAAAKPIFESDADLIQTLEAEAKARTAENPLISLDAGKIPEELARVKAEIKHQLLLSGVKNPSDDLIRAIAYAHFNSAKSADNPGHITALINFVIQNHAVLVDPEARNAWINLRAQGAKNLLASADVQPKDGKVSPGELRAYLDKVVANRKNMSAENKATWDREIAFLKDIESGKLSLSDHSVRKRFDRIQHKLETDAFLAKLDEDTRKKLCEACKHCPIG